MTEHKAALYSPTTLAGLAQRLPKPIVHDAAAGDDNRLALLFDSEASGILPFGDRLILTAGLSGSSLFSETESDMATYRRRPIRLWPFLRWDGNVLISLRETLVIDSGESRLRPLPNRLIYVREDFNSEPPYIEESIDVSAAQSIRLAEI